MTDEPRFTKIPIWLKDIATRLAMDVTKLTKPRICIFEATPGGNLAHFKIQVSDDEKQTVIAWGRLAV